MWNVAIVYIQLNFDVRFNEHLVQLCRGCTKLLLIVYYCSRQLELLSGVCGHMSALSCKKVSKAYTVISFIKLPC